MRRLLPWLLVAACAPISARTMMPNPARTTDQVSARQSYEIGPYRDDHRYEVTFAGWKPDRLRFAVHLVNLDPCGRPDAYVFTLVDDHDRTYAWQPARSATTRQLAGHAGATLTDSEVEGEFPAPVGPTTRFVTFRVRPVNGGACSALDFRWDFRG